MNIACLDGVHRYSFYVLGAHEYGVSLEKCKQILTFNIKMPDYTELTVTDYHGYDLNRILCVDNLDCFSSDVLKALRFISSSENCERATAYSYMGAVRLVSEPVVDLSAEMLGAVFSHALTLPRRETLREVSYNGSSVREVDGGPAYFATVAISAVLDRGRKM